MAIRNPCCPRNFPANWIGGLVLFGVLLVISPARAATEYCVSTPSELTDAVTLAQFNTGSNSIRLRPGTYVMPNGVSFTNSFGGDLYISGDWNSNCTVRGENPYSTVIQGNGTESRAWRLRGGSIEIQIRLMHFSAVSSIFFVDNFYNCEYQGQAFVADRVIVSGTSQGEAQLSIETNCHRALVVNSLILGGEQGIQFAGTDADEASPITLTHNTIKGASGFSLFADNFGDAAGQLYLYNNVFDRTGSEADVRLRNFGALAIGNHWSVVPSLDNASLLPGSSNNVSGDPQLQSNGRPVEPGSPVINTASNSVPGGLPGTDIEGNARVIGGAPDRGAFETDVTNSAVISVTDPNDSGPGTLRQAIIAANASPGAQIITFNIPGSCPQSIFLQSPLPSLTDTGLLLINGQTQPGSSGNTLVDGNNASICIQLRKSAQVTSLTHAVKVPVGSDTFLILRGIGFGGFGNAIELADGNGHLIQGNRFGEPLPSSSIGVLVGPGSDGVKIGGTDSPSLRNTISNSSFAGVFINGSDNVEIGNNYIGTDPNGIAAAPNNVGVFLQNASNTRIFSNVISGNTLSGVLLSGGDTTDTLITDNHIGVSRDTTSGTFPRGNGTAGVNIISGAHDNRIGGTLRDTSNIIATNGGDGVAVQSGQRNTISGNRIFGNAELGIDLAGNGVTLNDDDSNSVPADFANRGLNFPVLLSAIGGDSSGSVSGNLSTTRGGYRLEFFVNASCDASGHGEGSATIGATDVLIPNVPGQQTVAFTASVQIANATLSGWISATSTDSSGNTSEFSACIPYDSSDVIFADDFE